MFLAQSENGFKSEIKTENVLNSIFNVLFFSGPCPSSRAGLEGTQANFNALLRYSLATSQSVNGSTNIRGLETNLNSSLTSVCEMLPTIPSLFYCTAHGRDILFQVNYTTQSWVVSSLSYRLPQEKRVSEAVALVCQYKPLFNDL